MVTIGSLWLPILVSAIVVFFASFIMWMVSPHHRPDWGKVAQEDDLRAAMRKAKIGPGQYYIPHCGQPKEMSSPEYVKKLEEGPVAMVVVRPSGKPAMGKSMAMSFVYNVVVAVFAAYLATRTLGATADYLAVFRIVGTVTFLSYAGALIWGPIWFGRTWSSTIKEVLDGLVYGLLTAGIFGWLWPR